MPLVDELLDERRAQVVDVHREPAREVEDALLDLLGAARGSGSASPPPRPSSGFVRVAQVAHDGRPARPGTPSGIWNLRRVARARPR